MGVASVCGRWVGGAGVGTGGGPGQPGQRMGRVHEREGAPYRTPSMNTGGPATKNLQFSGRAPGEILKFSRRFDAAGCSGRGGLGWGLLGGGRVGDRVRDLRVPPKFC